jgi:nucleoside-diphosphate-sugar epimerase
VNHYALSKSQFLDWLKVHSGEIRAINLTLEHFYGAFDNETKFATFIIRSLVNNVEYIDLTRGDQRRYFVHISDVVKAFTAVLANHQALERNFHSFDVSSECSTSVKDFVLLAKDLTGNSITRLNFGALPYRQNEVMDLKTDLSGLNSLGWFPAVSLERGLIQTIGEERTT